MFRCLGEKIMKAIIIIVRHSLLFIYDENCDCCGYHNFLQYSSITMEEKIRVSHLRTTMATLKFGVSWVHFDISSLFLYSDSM